MSVLSIVSEFTLSECTYIAYVMNILVLNNNDSHAYQSVCACLIGTLQVISWNGGMAQWLECCIFGWWAFHDICLIYG